MKGISTMPIRTLRSSPVIVSVDCPGSLMGSKNPAGSRVVSSSDRLLTANVSWKPLRSRPLVTETAVRASVTGSGAGMGTPGPMSSVRWTPLSTGQTSCGGDALGQRDAQPAAHRGGQVVGAKGPVRVADAPKLKGVVKVGRRDVVQALPLGHHVLGQHDEALGLGHEPAAKVDDQDTGGT